MSHQILRDLDQEYKLKRAQLIAKNYDMIVGEIHKLLQTQIINLISVLNAQEITKFDYMTNLELEGDRHLWIDFLDDANTYNCLKIIIGLKSADICILNDNKYHLSEISLEVETIEAFSKLCLNVFRRGYDKPD